MPAKSSDFAISWLFRSALHKRPTEKRRESAKIDQPRKKEDQPDDPDDIAADSVEGMIGPKHEQNADDGADDAGSAAKEKINHAKALWNDRGKTLAGV